MNINEVAQWVIDNRYPKSEFEKLSDHELYHGLIEKIELILQQNNGKPHVSGSLPLFKCKCGYETNNSLGWSVHADCCNGNDH